MRDRSEADDGRYRGDMTALFTVYAVVSIFLWGGTVAYAWVWSDEPREKQRAAKLLLFTPFYVWIAIPIVLFFVWRIAYPKPDKER